MESKSINLLINAYYAILPTIEQINICWDLAARRWPIKIRSKIRGSMQDFKKIGGRFYYKSCLYIPDNNKDLRTKLIYQMHLAAPAGYPGEHQIYMLMRRYYYWPGISNNVFGHIAACKLCRCTKLSKEKPPGLLSPLPIPEY